MNNFPLCYIVLQFFPQFVFFLSFLPSAATPLSSQAPLPLSFRPRESPCYSAQGLSLSFRKRSLPSVISRALSCCHFERAKRVEKSVLSRAASLLSVFRLPPAELRSAAPHFGPSQNLLRHHFVITCIFRAPPPALSGGGYVRLVAA